MEKTQRLFLEKARAIRTLLCLLRYENRGLDELLELIGGSKSTGMKRIIELIEMGLVEKKASIKESRKMLYLLTPKGKQIAQMLQKIVNSIEDLRK